MVRRSLNAQRFFSRPRRDPVAAGLFSQGTPHRHLARTISCCEACGGGAVLDIFAASDKVVPGLPSGLSCDLLEGPWGEASCWWLCAACGAHGRVENSRALAFA